MGLAKGCGPTPSASVLPACGDGPAPTNLELLGLFRRCAHAQRPPQGLHGQNRLLVVLSEHGSITQRALGEVMQRTPATLAQQLASMEEAGLVERRRRRDDRRSVEVRLTDAGRDAARRASEERVRRADELFGGLGDRDRRELARILGGLLARWTSPGASAAPGDGTVR